MNGLASAWPSLVDIAIVLTMALSLMFGLFRGLLRELLSLISWITAFWIAYRYSVDVAQAIDPVLQNPTLSRVLAVVLVFVGVLVGLLLLASLIAKIFKATGLAGMDRLLGGLFGLVRALVILGAVLLLARNTGAPQQDWYNASMIIPIFDPAVDWTAQYLVPGMLEGFETHLLDGALPSASDSTD